jgi:hypothetical protein
MLEVGDDEFGEAVLWSASDGAVELAIAPSLPAANIVALDTSGVTAVGARACSRFCLFGERRAIR